ncbi:MAG: prepilin-type N-terminal cleavage/methylation domain-containing protein [Ignisphaera sp.]|nr:prepilin-type N-terminal cleavage/methylation domain-containing protein [Ignisphaera sp.]
MKKNGFTLIELLLVLAIIGIIAAIAIPALLGQKHKNQEVATETIMTVDEMIAANGPPDKIDKMDSHTGNLSFAYYKQPDGTVKVFTIKYERVINETRK